MQVARLKGRGRHGGRCECGVRWVEGRRGGRCLGGCVCAGGPTLTNAPHACLTQLQSCGVCVWHIRKEQGVVVVDGMGRVTSGLAGCGGGGRVDAWRGSGYHEAGL